MGKLSILIFIVIFGALAIMFDWFGARELSQQGLDVTQDTMEKLEETGDAVSVAIEKAKEMAPEQIKE